MFIWLGSHLSGVAFPQIERVGPIRTSIRMALAIPTKEEANIRRFQEIERELRGLATNFNQLTRAANAGKLMWNEADSKRHRKVNERWLE